MALMNVGFTCDWANDLLADMIRYARSPGSVAKPYDESFDDWHNCGPDGWPLEDFGIVIATNKQAGHLTGRHLLVFEGSATVSATNSPGVTLTRRTGVADSSYWVDCDATAVNLWLTFTGASSRVHNVALYRNGANGTVLNAAAKAALAPFSGLRTMNWGTNSDQEIEWASREKIGGAPWHHHVTRYPDGTPLIWDSNLEAFPTVPWELHISVAAELQKDLWICVPAMASDDYIRQLAALFAASFPLGQTLYVEYANETWNGQFEANLWMVYNQGGGSWDKFRDMRAARLLYISDTFKAAMGSRCRIVCAGQVGYNPSTEWQASDITRIRAAGRDPSKVIDLIAMAPYLDIDYPAKLDASGQPLKDQWGGVVTISDAEKPAYLATLSPAQIRDILLSKISGWVSPALDTYAAFAQANNIGGVAVYEGGIEPPPLAVLRNTPEGAEVLAAFAALLASKTSASCWFDLAGDGYSFLDYLDSSTLAFKALAAAAQAAPQSPAGEPIPIPTPAPTPIPPSPGVITIQANDIGTTADLGLSGRWTKNEAKGHGLFWCDLRATIPARVPASAVPALYAIECLGHTSNIKDDPTVIATLNGHSLGTLHPKRNQPGMLLAGLAWLTPGDQILLTVVDYGFYFYRLILTPIVPVVPADGTLTITVTRAGQAVESSAKFLSAPAANPGA